MEELEIEIPGFEIAGLAWGGEGERPVLAMHGWLDNAATMARVAPRLEGYRVVSIDFPGHGKSSHRPVGQAYHFVDLIPSIFDVANALGWERFSILAHSMGAAASLLAAGARPERIGRMFLIDGLGPWTNAPEEAPEVLARGLEERETLLEKSNRRFESDQEALGVIAGLYGLTEEEARPLVERGLVRAEDGSVHFSYDLMLRGKSLVRFTEKQVMAFLERIEAPTRLIRPSDGWPIDEEMAQRRIDAVSTLEVVEVEGGHHVHLEAPGRIAESAREFLG